MIGDKGEEQYSSQIHGPKLQSTFYSRSLGSVTASNVPFPPTRDGAVNHCEMNDLTTFPALQRKKKLRHSQGCESEGSGHDLEEGKNLPLILGQEGSVGAVLCPHLLLPRQTSKGEGLTPGTELGTPSQALNENLSALRALRTSCTRPQRPPPWPPDTLTPHWSGDSFQEDKNCFISRH